MFKQKQPVRTGRKLMMAGNWKMNKNWSESVVLAQGISNRAKGNWGNIDIVLCPATVNLKAVRSVLEFDNSTIELGAQNCHWEASGAYTGEVSVSMLDEVGATYCIVGHSERRQYFGETDETVNKKVNALLAGGLKPIVCVGESLAVRDSGAYVEFVRGQVNAAFAGLDPEQVAKCTVAYEPIWAIGTGRTATPEQAQEVCSEIRSFIEQTFGYDAAQAVRVLYGGSMNPGNVDGLIAQPDIDGGLIGGASLKADSFVELINAALKA